LALDFFGPHEFATAAIAITAIHASMAGIKRKSAAPVATEAKSKNKKAKLDKSSKVSAKDDVVPRTKSSKKQKVIEEPEDSVESDTTEDEIGFDGFSASKEETFDSHETSDSTDDSELHQDKEPSNAIKAVKSSQAQPDGQSSALSALNGTPPRLLQMVA
jgi:pumilio homology domain family member 6